MTNIRLKQNRYKRDLQHFVVPEIKEIIFLKKIDSSSKGLILDKSRTILVPK